MARVKILADSTCDLTPALLRQYDITLTPLVVIKDGQQFHDGVDITPADIFAHVDAGGKLCSTAAVSEYEYTQMFARFTPDYDTVIQITIGSGFSACYQNACLAAQAFENVIVIDSENLSTGQGLLVIAAARLAEQGLTGEEIAAQVRALVPKVEASFLVERLEGRDDSRLELAFITHPAAQPTVVQAAKDAAAKYGAFGEVIETNAGCTVSCHCGPHTLGILFIRK